MASCIGALDQGTTSTRFMIFNFEGNEISRDQKEHRQILPRPGWVEHNPKEILERTCEVVEAALRKAGLRPSDLAAIGITNQRETTVVWDRRSGEPLHTALVWQDTRNADAIERLARSDKAELIRSRTGLPPATYFSGGKLQWLLENVPGLRESATSGGALFGTIDTWLLWNLTGGPRGGVHATDVTNASRTMLMNLETLAWDPELLEIFGIPAAMLPSILPSAAHFGVTSPDSPFGAGLPIAGVLGDQQAATVGQVCFDPGQAKNTYGTGNFMLLNLGPKAVPSKTGLLTTVCYQWEGKPAVYALEGSIAVTGSAVQWLRDQLGLIREAREVEALANTVEDNGGVYFVPAFSGLFAPYWRSDARGVIVGLSRYADRGHLARATLEAICSQTSDVFEAMCSDSGVRLEEMKVDGGAAMNDTLMQMQADILGVRVVRPRISETTSLGAAYAAGLAVGVYRGEEELRQKWSVDKEWHPKWSEDRRESHLRQWKKAVERSLGWMD